MIAWRVDSSVQTTLAQPMLRRLSLRNFKCWEHGEISFGRITGLFGANSSGKTSFGQLLLLLKQTKDSTDRGLALHLNGRFVRLGTALDVISRHDRGRTLEFKLEFDGPAALSLPDSENGERFEIKDAGIRSIAAEAEIRGGAFRGRRLSYGVGGACFSLKPNPRKSGVFDLLGDVPGTEFEFKRSKGRPSNRSGPVTTYQFPDAVRTGYLNSSFLADLEAEFERALDRVHYLGPLREAPSRDYLWERSRPADIGEKGERTIAALISSEQRQYWQNLAKYKKKWPLGYIVAHWLRELSLLEDFKVSEIAEGSNRYEVRVQTARRSPSVLLTDVGFGVAQVLPVLTLLYYVPEGSTVLLERPELHLHPMAQAELADVIIHSATHRNIQVILESHSEHLLLRMQRRIAESKAEQQQSEGTSHQVVADNFKFYFCRRDKRVSRIQELELDSYGNILNWPENFFGDAFSEAAAAELARLRAI